jgi:radical SAM superfamily enzyme YgiQ (UPF0313 family)
MRDKLRIGLVSLLGGEHISNSRADVYNDTEPLGLLCVGGVAEQEGHEVRIFHPNQKANPSEGAITSSLINYKPDILAISSMTNTFNRSMRLAEEVKQALPQIEVVVGGDHIGTNLSDVSNYPIIDVGVYGEGEETFREILKGKPKESIKGIVYMRNGNIQINPLRPRIIDRTKLPHPIRDSELLKNSKVGALMYPTMSEQTGAASILFQLGCNLGCSYCNATDVYGSKITKSSPEFVIEELADLKDRFNINTAFLTDLTFNLNSKLAEDFCNNLEQANLGVSWYALVRPTSPSNQPMLKKSTLEAMTNAGCTKIGFGIESFEKSAMHDYHRPTSLDEDYRTLRTIDKLGALSKVFFILGHPEEKTEYYDEITKTLKWLRPDEVRISFLTPFPGTELWRSMMDKNRDEFLTKNYDDYTTFKPVLKMNYISPEQLINQRARILNEYYTSDAFKQHTNKKIVQNPRLERSYDEFFDLLGKKGII